MNETFKQPTIVEIFLEFLLIGATSFGVVVVAYLRNSLVAKRHGVNDKEFVEPLSISQTLPGLNATNMAMLVGDRSLVSAMLKGVAAAAVGLILATAVQLGKRSLPHAYDLIFVAATVLGVNRLHQFVPRVLICVGIIAILRYNPARLRKENPAP